MEIARAPIPYRLSVIIPTCHRNGLLAQCLDRLAPGKQTFDPEHYEVIVTDDGSRGNAREMIQNQYSWVQWVQGPQKGPAANRNNGAKHAKGEWLVFTDDDCLPDTNWLKAYFDAIIKFPNHKAFEGAIYPTDWNELNRDMTECPVNTDGGCFWTANVAIDKATFSLIGGFDERFKIAAQEDQDIFIRISRWQKPIFLNNAVVLHPVKQINFIEKCRNLNIKSESYILFVFKHKIETRLWRFVYSQFLHYLSMSNASIKSRKYKSTLLFLCLCVVLLPLNSFNYLRFKNHEKYSG